MSAVVTTEVRWFLPGVLPPSFQEWFDSIPGSSVHEMRRDIYDLEAAHQKVGLKRRYPARTLDCKMMLSAHPGVDLGVEITGDREDWIKISQPLDDDAEGPGRVLISKKTQAKRRFLDTDTGCEAELAEISMGSITAWTLCLETFGDPDLRTTAFDHGLEAVFGHLGTPPNVDLNAESSLSYPEWISMMHSGAGATLERFGDSLRWMGSEVVGQEGTQAS